MLQLFKTISWMETHRVKTRLVLLGSLVALAMLIMTNVAPYEHKDGKTDDIYEHMLQALPSMPGPFMGLLLGLVVVASLPLRSKNEWESGRYQTAALGRYSQSRIESCKFVFHLVIATAFVFTLSIPWAIYVNTLFGLEMSEIFVLLAVTWMGIASMIPVVFGLGSVVTALTASYSLKGRPHILTFLTYAGTLCFFSLYANQVCTWINESGLFFGPVTFDFHTGGETYPLFIYPDTVLSGLVLSIMLVVLAGRIFDEAEV